MSYCYTLYSSSHPYSGIWPWITQRLYGMMDACHKQRSNKIKHILHPWYCWINQILDYHCFVQRGIRICIDMDYVYKSRINQSKTVAQKKPKIFRFSFNFTRHVTAALSRFCFVGLRICTNTQHNQKQIKMTLHKQGFAQS